MYYSLYKYANYVYDIVYINTQTTYVSFCVYEVNTMVEHIHSLHMYGNLYISTILDVYSLLEFGVPKLLLTSLLPPAVRDHSPRQQSVTAVRDISP